MSSLALPGKGASPIFLAICEALMHVRNTLALSVLNLVASVDELPPSLARLCHGTLSEPAYFEQRLHFFTFTKMSHF